MRNRVKRIHFVGIGGSGMSGIAEVLHHLDYRVSGSDIASNASIARLLELGVQIQIGHSAENVTSCDVVVVSSAIDETNPEIIQALVLNIPVIPRAEMLAELMRFKDGIAVAGTHGKTTTTSLIASILMAAEMDPTFVVGGLVNSTGANAKLGGGEYMVAEADESDASFLNLKPLLAVVTNIDEDHMSTYQGSLDNLKQNFVSFIQNLPFYGCVVLCNDSENILAIKEHIHKPIISYAIDNEADFMAHNLQQNGMQMRFDVQRPNAQSLPVCLSIPGKHNVLNALAAIAIASYLGVKDSAIKEGLAQFQGINRRFEILGDVQIEHKKVSIVDDYAHHPVEIAATLSAARGCWPNRRLVVVFEPHRYSRTHDLFDAFVEVLSDVDILLVSEVYPAGEQVISGATSTALCQAIRVRGKSNPIYLSDMNTLLMTLSPIVEDGDVILHLGAGSIGKVVREMYAKLIGGGNES